MKGGKGPVKGLIIAAGVLSVMLLVTVFSFFFVSAGESEPANAVQSSSSRHVTIGEGTTPHSSSTSRSREASSVSASVSDSSATVPSSSTVPSEPESSEPLSTASSESTEPEPESQPEPPPESEPESKSESKMDATQNPSKNTNSAGKDRRSNWSNGAYLGSSESDKYHDYECRAAKNILPGNEVWFESEDEAKAAGYSRCGICW